MTEVNEVIVLMLKKSDLKLKTAIVDFDNSLYSDCVSCCYYSVFHAINALLCSKGKSFSSHKQTIGNFNKIFIKDKFLPTWITKEIYELFNERQKCDYSYDLEKLPTKEEALEKIEITKKILQECKIYLKKNDFTNIE